MPTRVISSTYRHQQTTPATTWTIVHNLGGAGGSGIPVVDVIVDYNGQKVKVMSREINIVDKNTITVVFTTAQSGEAIVIG